MHFSEVTSCSLTMSWSLQNLPWLPHVDFVENVLHANLNFELWFKCFFLWKGYKYFRNVTGSAPMHTSTKAVYKSSQSSLKAKERGVLISWLDVFIDGVSTNGSPALLQVEVLHMDLTDRKATCIHLPCAAWHSSTKTLCVDSGSPPPNKLTMHSLYS